MVQFKIVSIKKFKTCGTHATDPPSLEYNSKGTHNYNIRKQSKI